MVRGFFGVQIQALVINKGPQGVIFFIDAGVNNFAPKGPEGKGLFTSVA